MSPNLEWNVVHERGSAAEMHARAVPEGATRELWWFDVERPALVLGSTQPESAIDVEACRAAGIGVVRRRSGGGSVLMLPGEIVWLDVVIGRDDPWWDDDVGRSSWWLGEVWRAALEELGAVAPSVHRGTMVATEWSRAVCFAGLGPGEVTSAITSTGAGATAKVLGLSQRRTRSWARFQCAVHRVWRPDLVASLLTPPAPSVADLEPLVVAIDATPAEIAGAFTAALVAAG